MNSNASGQYPDSWHGSCWETCRLGRTARETSRVERIQSETSTLDTNPGERLRRRNGESSCYLGSDGRWHGRVSVGLRPDGSPDRRHVSGRDRDVVLSKIAKLEVLRDAGKVVSPSRVPTVANWMRTA
jgi:hypothetical protein